jgi:hypothetical protein
MINGKKLIVSVMCMFLTLILAGSAFGGGCSGHFGSFATPIKGADVWSGVLFINFDIVDPSTAPDTRIPGSEPISPETGYQDYLVKVSFNLKISLPQKGNLPPVEKAFSGIGVYEDEDGIIYNQFWLLGDSCGGIGQAFKKFLCDVVSTDPDFTDGHAELLSASDPEGFSNVGNQDEFGTYPAGEPLYATSEVEIQYNPDPNSFWCSGRY